MSVKKSVSVLSHPDRYINCFLKDGVLIPGFSKSMHKNARPLEYTTTAVYSKIASLYIFGGDEEIYVSRNGYDYTRYDYFSCFRPFLIEDYIDGKMQVVFITGPHAAVYNGSGFDKIELPQIFWNGVMHCGRLFSVDGYKVIWSGPKGFSDWEEGINGCGHLELDSARGRPYTLFVLGGKIVIVREFGFTVLSMYGSPENFSVESTDTDSNLIINFSFSVVKDKLYFLTDDGIKCFDGSKITPIPFDYTFLDVQTATSYGGKYFLAGYIKEFSCDMIICIDTELGANCFIDQYACYFCVKNGLEFFDNESHYFLSNERNGSYSFESKELDFGTDKFKTVTEIRVSGKANISISNGRHTKNYTVSDGIVYPHFKGRKFKVTVWGNDRVDDLTVIAEVPDEV